MKTARWLLLSSCAALAVVAAEPAGAFATGRYRDLFQEYLGKSEAEVDAKLAGAWDHFFRGDENSQRLFYPIAGDMAYVPDINNNDVRSEGLSYAMMICVQTDHQKEFNQIWRYAKHYMWHDSGPLRGYFTWHTAFNGRKIPGVGPAPDGEEWFVMALFFAAHRWASDTTVGSIFNYEAEAQSLLRTMLHKDEEPHRGALQNMFHRDAKQINFVPHGPGADYTDPSYHLPAFYELWSRWAAAPEDRATLVQITATSRELFKKVAHPQTGLMPDICGFDGKPARVGRFDFSYDAWRTLSNPALDFAWWAADSWEVGQANRVLTFLASQGNGIIDSYQLDGTPAGTSANPSGLLAMAATAALAAERKLGEPYVQRLWDAELPSGHYRYYNGLLTTLALLEVSGHFRVYAPPSTL